MARPGRVINTKSWIGVHTAAVPVVLTATQGAILSIGIAEGSIRETLLRSRGSLVVSAFPNNATDEGMVALGLIVVHSNAVTAGGAALPGPLNDQGADWLWHNYVPVTNPIGATTISNAWGGFHTQRVELDSRAMRRVPADHEVVLMGEVDSSFWSSVEVVGGMRLLFGH